MNTINKFPIIQKSDGKDDDEFKKLVRERVYVDNKICRINIIRNELIDRKKYLDKIIIEKIEQSNSNQPYDFSYERMEEANRNNEIIREELLKVTLHPDRDISWYLSIDKVNEIKSQFKK